MVHGSVASVVDQRLAFREEAGDPGMLRYTGKDRLDRALGRRSMVLMAEEVTRRVNAVLGPGGAGRAVAD